MKHLLRATVLGFCVALGAHGSLILDLDLSTTSIAPGDSFAITFNLLCDASEPVQNLSYLLTASAPGLFTITGRDYAASLFQDMMSTDEEILAPADAILDPSNGRDLGALTDDGLSLVGPSFFLCTLDVQSDPLTPGGQYTFLPSDFFAGTGFDFDFQEYDPSTLGVSGATLTVVPEPGSLSLLVLVAASGLMRRRRRP